jgi:hypothetical protein
MPASLGNLSAGSITINKTSGGSLALAFGTGTTLNSSTITATAGNTSGTNTLLRLNTSGTLNMNGGTFTNPPTYVGAGTITYASSSADLTMGNEVQGLSTATTINISTSSSRVVSLGANLALNSGSSLVVNSGGIFNPNGFVLSGAGSSFTLSSGGTLRINSTSGGISGLITNATQNWNGGTISFNGTGTQAMGLGTNSLSSVAIAVNGTSNTLTFDPTTSGTIGSLNISNGNVFDLNGKTMTINAGSSGTTLTTNASGTFTHNSGKVIFVGAGTVHTLSGTLAFKDVDVTPTSGLLGVDFGSASSISSTGTMTLTSGSYVSTNAPTYAAGSLLKYSNASTFVQSSEWNNTPSNVQISNITSFQTATNAGTPKTISGNLTIDAGSTFTMAVNNTSSTITVAGKVVVNGTLTLSTTIGGDLNVGDSLVFNTGSTFNGNTREVTFNGTGFQTVGGTITTLPNMQFVHVNKASGTFQFTKPLALNNGSSSARFRVTTGTVDLNGQGFTFGGAGAKQLRMDAGTITTNGSALHTFNEYTNSSGSVTGTLNGTINFNGSGSESLPACNMNTVNLQTSGVKTLTANSQINGTFSIQGTATVAGAFALTYGTGAGLDLSPSTSLTTADRFFPSASGPAVLTINSGANTVTLHSSRTIGITLNFTSGDMNTGSNTLTLGTSSSSTGTLNVSGTGSIIGNFKRFISASSTSYVFPVGVAGTRRSSTINFTGAPSVGGSLTATFVASAPSTTGLPLTEGAINVDRVATSGYWTVSAADGLSGGTYTASFTGSGFIGVGDFSKLVLLKRSNSGSSWALNGTHVTTTGSNSTPVLSRSGMSGFSDFAIGGNSSENTLPVTLKNFSAQRSGTPVVLKWNTACEIDNKDFDVQRSLDGRNFITISKIEGNGTSCKGFDYSFTDLSAPTSSAFYRLVQNDYNGNQTTLPTVRVAALSEKGKNWTVQLSPNPGNGNIQIINSGNEIASIKILDVKGQLLEESINTTDISTALTSRLMNLQSGLYIIQLSSLNGELKIVRYVKE